MKIIALIYLISLVLSLISLRRIERKVGARKGTLWAPALVPGWNTLISIWFLTSLVEVGIRKIFPRR